MSESGEGYYVEWLKDTGIKTKHEGLTGRNRNVLRFRVLSSPGDSLNRVEIDFPVKSLSGEIAFKDVFYKVSGSEVLNSDESLRNNSSQNEDLDHRILGYNSQKLVRWIQDNPHFVYLDNERVLDSEDFPDFRRPLVEDED